MSVVLAPSAEAENLMSSSATVCHWLCTAWMDELTIELCDW